MARKKVEKKLNTYWASWYSGVHIKEFEYHGPWWVTGMDSDMRDIIIAVVQAGSEKEAIDAFRKSYDKPPKTLEMRFCNMIPNDQEIFSERFAREAWMVWPVSAELAAFYRKKAIKERERFMKEDASR